MLLMLTVEVSDDLPAGVAGVYDAHDSEPARVVLAPGLTGQTAAQLVSMLLGRVWEGVRDVRAGNANGTVEGDIPGRGR